MGERHRLVIDQKNTKRWDACFGNMVSLHACVARCLDSKDNVLDTMVIAPRPVEAVDPDNGRPAVELPATNQGVDVAAIVNTVAQAITTSVKEAMSAMAQATAQSFSELTNFARASNERALISERERMRAIEERERRVQDEEERIEEERERAEEERERADQEREDERAENANLKELMMPVLAAAAPALATAVGDMISKRSPRKRSRSRRSPSTTPRKSANGAKAGPKA